MNGRMNKDASADDRLRVRAGANAKIEFLGSSSALFARSLFRVVLHLLSRFPSPRELLFLPASHIFPRAYFSNSIKAWNWNPWQRLTFCVF